MKETETTSKKTGVLKRIMQSTAVLLVVFFALSEYAIREIRPLRMFNHTGLTTINQNFLVSKLPPCMSSHQNSEVLLLGSSLVLVPSVRCDDQFHGRKTRYDRWYYRNVIDEYVKADYFQDSLSKATNRDVKVLDLAVAASMMSDQYLILKKYLASGKKPQLIVCGIAPRDFLDNMRPDPEKTPTYSILADLTCINDLLDQKRSKEAICNFALGYFSDVYKNRSDYKTFLAGWAGRVTNHPIDFYTAVSQLPKAGEKKPAEEADGAAMFNTLKADAGVLDNSKPDYGPKQNKLNDLNEYKKIYLPVNAKLFKMQMSYLDKFLSLANENEIPVVLVKMPVTSENWSILPDEIKDRYKNKVAKLATKYNAKVVEPAENLTFELNDYEDSVHMNAGGGNKVFSFVAREIADDKQLATRWSSHGTQIGSVPFKWPF